MRDDTLHSAQPSSKEATVLASLPLLDRLLPLWILLAMARESLGNAGLINVGPAKPD
jgi:hypothetical protein